MSLRSRVRPVVRVLILSWEYPPIVEGGLARHVRKLSEALVREGVDVHVLTRGGARTTPHEERHGVHVHRVAEPEYPDDLNRFVAWVRTMNAHMLRAGAELVDELAPDLVHGHDWLVGRAARPLPRRAPPRRGAPAARPPSPPAARGRRCWRPSTRPSTAATTAGSTSHPSRPSTRSRGASPAGPTASSSARTTCRATSPTSSGSTRRVSPSSPTASTRRTSSRSPT